MSTLHPAPALTAQLAAFVVETPSSAIPAAVRRHAVRTLVNWSACALGGAHDPTVEAAMAALLPLAGSGRSAVLGRGERTDALHAALFNGIGSHVLDFDDTHLETLVHPGGPVLSAIAALAQQQAVTGQAFVDALVLGIEVECRIGLGLGKAHYDTGWHVTSTAGVCGAAAAAGRLLGLDRTRMAWALGIAATQASGLREMFGSMCKSLHAGKAAQNGLSAALLAQAGFTSSAQGLEAPRGLLAVLSAAPAPQRVLDGLGSRWETLANTFKPYACGLVIHPVIDACRELAAQGTLEAEQVERVQLLVHPLVLELTGKTAPASGLEAKFSVFHSAAATLREGGSRLAHFSDASVRDPRNAALRERIAAEVRGDIRADEAIVRLTLRDGSAREVHVEHALGSLQRPMSEAELDAKFHELAAGVLPPAAVQRALQLCWQVDEATCAGAVFDALAQESGT